MLTADSVRRRILGFGYPFDDSIIAKAMSVFHKQQRLSFIGSARGEFTFSHHFDPKIIRTDEHVFDLTPFYDWSLLLAVYNAAWLGDRSHDKNAWLSNAVYGASTECLCCVLLCKDRLDEWKYRAMCGGSNVGRDILREWCGLEKDVEVKSINNPKGTTIFVRAPVGCAQFVKSKHIPDSYFECYKVHDGVHVEFLGHCDRPFFIKYGRDKNTPGNPLRIPSTGVPAFGFDCDELVSQGVSLNMRHVTDV